MVSPNSTYTALHCNANNLMCRAVVVVWCAVTVQKMECVQFVQFVQFIYFVQFIRFVNFLLFGMFVQEIQFKQFIQIVQQWCAVGVAQMELLCSKSILHGLQGNSLYILQYSFTG